MAAVGPEGSGSGDRSPRAASRKLAGTVAAVLLTALVPVGLAGCGGHAVADPALQQRFLNSVYSQAPDISGYRTGRQLLALGQVVCADLRAGASPQLLGDRVPLVEGSSQLPPADLGVVISSAVAQLCPRYHKVLGR
jgi:hypothetical protein